MGNAQTEDVEERIEKLVTEMVPGTFRFDHEDDSVSLSTENWNEMWANIDDRMGTLRPRLEEAEEENEHLRELVANESENAATFRRRVDRLEEAARECESSPANMRSSVSWLEEEAAAEKHGGTNHLSGNKVAELKAAALRLDRAADLLDRLFAALDSREDEGGVGRATYQRMYLPAVCGGRQLSGPRRRARGGRASNRVRVRFVRRAVLVRDGGAGPGRGAH